ncbi:MAG: bifunctional riboflavin kinase/FAD synthetase [Gemmataceae bacterium]
MRVYSLNAGAEFPDVLRGGAVSIGNFDGVHKGHAALIQQLHSQARRLGGPAVGVTFDPHPLRLLAPERFMPQLTTASDRAEYLLQAGCDRVVILQTDSNLLQLKAREFLDRVVRDRLGAKFLVEGYNFGFGRNREGNTQLLQEWCDSANIGLSVIESVRLPNGEPISSSRVRAALDSGHVEAATELLGRPYRLRGRVVQGEHRGVGLGFPTANLVECPTVIPGDGVYAGRAAAPEGTWLAAINIGPNPTFGENTRKVEAHLIDFNGDLYESELAIDFLSRLRDVKRFASKDELVAQLHKDIEEVRRVAE